MSATTVARDERTTAVENASFRWAYLLLSFGLLASVAYRGFARGESSWDLLALVVGAGLLVSLYQATHRVLTRRWATLTLVAVIVAAVLGVALSTGTRGFAAARATAEAARSAR